MSTLAEKKSRPSVEHIEPGHDSQQLAAHASDFEDHDLTIWHTVKRNPWACFWCVYALWTITLVAFETQAANAVVGIPRFRKDFGFEYPVGSGKHVIPAKWQSAFNGAPQAAKVIAVLVTGQIADMIGRRYTILLSLVISFVAIGIEFMATTNAVFFAGKFTNGLSIGIIAVAMVSYIGEIAPLKLRGIFGCCIGVSYGVGPLVAFIIVKYSGGVDTRWAYRTIFCAQWGFAAVALLLWPWMPESPWWLVSKGKNEKALKSLNRLGYKGDRGQQRLSLVQVTLEQHKQETEGVTYAECFRRSNRRRTIISLMPPCIQALSGIQFVAGYFTYYLQLAGYSTDESFKVQIAQPTLSIVGNLTAAACIDRVGRRNLTYYGLIILTAFLLITGGLGTQTKNPAFVKGTVSFILIYSYWYNVSIGSTAFALMSEISTPRLRYKTVAISLALNSSINVMWQFVLPFLFNPDQLNMGAKVAFIFGGLCFFCIIYLFYYQPETSGRSFQELDEMFSKGVPAREFKRYKTNAQEENDIAGGLMKGKEV
ncbi:general substrate transporter [Dendryphion nanum]|uniref:General substrate transporter n=1 Tax=Dendryphion nanum TaxID=256645 RepID=A0A9P9IJ13_9PLEO|nr:general substrate transporter [Dendryphion nanum]